MSNPLRNVEGVSESRKRRRRSAKAELAEMCVEEYMSDSTRTLTMAYMDEVRNDRRYLLTAAAAATVPALPCQPVSENTMLPSNSAGPSKKPLKVGDLLLCPDEEFDVHINITRRTIKTIFDAVKLEYKDFQYNDFLLLIWYLSSESSSLSKAAEVFEIQNEDEVLPRLVDTSSKLKWLLGSAKMELPKDEYDEDEIVECFKRRTDLPNILGALGVMRLECRDRSWLNVLTIVDHGRYFRHLSLSNSSHVVQDVLRNSPIYERLLQDHPKHYTFLCPAHGYPTLPQLLPGLREDEISLFDDMSDEMSDFDLRHNDVVDYVRTAIKEAVSRFPKLNELETASGEIISAAFMLHNFCNQLRDTSIYNYDALDSSFTVPR